MTGPRYGIAIVVRYRGPTDHRPARWIASTATGHRRVSIHRADLDCSTAARRAAEALTEQIECESLQSCGWHHGYRWDEAIVGELADGSRVYTVPTAGGKP